MKTFCILITSLLLTVLSQAQVSKTIELTSGNLDTLLTEEEKNTITSLTLIGSIDARDIVTTSEMPLLTDLDITQTAITAISIPPATFHANSIGTYGVLEKGVGSIFSPRLRSLQLPPTLTAIDIYGLSGCSGLLSFVIPPLVTRIGYSAFYGCSGLTSINIPSTVTAIADYAFFNCRSLEEITIPTSLTAISNRSFAFCSSLTTLTIPPSVERIDYFAFVGCTALTTVHFPASLRSIREGAFMLCPNITSIYSYNPFPPELDEDAFDMDKSNCMVYVPYGSGAYYSTAEGWKDFENIVETLPGFRLSANTVTIRSEQGSMATATIISDIEWTASSDQPWLTISSGAGTSTQELTFTAEANPTAYGRSARINFSATGHKSQTLTIIQGGTPKVLNLTAGSLLSVLTAEELSGITHLTLTGEIDAGDFITMTEQMPILSVVDLSKATIKAWAANQSYLANEIPYNAFFNKGSLTSILVPDSTKVIKYGVFYNCTGLTSIRIPSVLTLIEGSAFSNCMYLDTIYSFAPIPPDCSSSFNNVNVLTCKLMVPYGSKALYEQADGWKNFKNIEEMPGFKLSANVITIKAGEGSTAGIKITSVVEWTAATGQQWLEVSPAAGTGSQLVTFTADANTSAYGRMGTVTFSANGIEQNITVIQEGLAKTIDLIAGTLSELLTREELNGITHLIITGEMDARDFRTMRDKMPLLTSIDIRQAAIKAYTGPDGTAITYHDQYPYAANVLPLYAFFNDSSLIGKRNLTSIYLPETVKVIGNGAFSHCTGLTAIKIPSSVLRIDDNAFDWCNYLDTIYSYAKIPPELGDYRIFYNVNLASCQLYVPYGSAKYYTKSRIWQDFIHITEMPGFSVSPQTVYINAKQNDIGTVTIDTNVTWNAGSDQEWLLINPASGTGMNNLTLTAETNPNDAGRMAILTFSAPGMLSQQITVIQEGKPVTVNLSAGTLSSILTDKELNEITNLTILGEIDARDFKTMRDSMPLLSVVDLSKATIITYKGLNGTYEYPQEIDYQANAVPMYAFFNFETYKGKNSLTSILLPDSVKVIGYHAFLHSTGLSVITIPSSVTEIQDKAFSHCSQLTAVYAYPVQPPNLSLNAFDRIDKTSCILYVPYGSKELYAAADGWKDFNHIVEMTEFELSAHELTLEAAAGSRSILITTNKEWSALSDKEWLTVSPASGNATQTIQLTALENTTSVARTATVTFTAKNGYSQTLVIIQKAKVNSIPMANAGTDQQVEEGENVQLDGTNSTDTDNEPLAYQWSAPDGILLSSASEAQPTFTAPKVMEDTILTFVLVVSNGKENSPPDEVLVTIANKIIELGVTTNAVSFESKESSANITITGNAQWTATNDKDWLSITPSSGEGQQEITFTAQANETFIERMSTVIVSAPEADPLAITVTQKAKINSIPVASAGEDQLVEEGKKVQLDGMKSSDAENDELIYQWSAPEGIILSSASDGKPTFTAPLVSKDTVLTFVLIVSDGKENSPPDEVLITIANKVIELGVSTNAVAFESMESYAKVIIAGNAQWTATCDVEWLSVDPSSGNGAKTITLTVQANKTTSDRVAIVTISAPEVNAKTITVSQVGLVTGIDEMISRMEIKIYPNPFTHELAIEVANEANSKVSVEIYDLSGQRVKSLAKALKEAKISLHWDGCNEQGQQVPGGVYILKVNEVVKQVMKGFNVEY